MSHCFLMDSSILLANPILKIASHLFPEDLIYFLLNNNIS